MVNIILTSHGGLAEGILQSGQMIFGAQDNVHAVCLTPDMGPDDLRAKLQAAIDSFDDPQEILFLVDLQGGTPWNQVSLLLDNAGDNHWVALSGLNLPMLIAAYGARFGCETAREVASEALGEARGGFQTKPGDIAKDAHDAASAPATPQAAPAGHAAIPEGTVLGDGHIKIGLARIDTRLLHGQVATSWTKSVKPDRIIVVSDTVCKDTLRKQMIIEAAPAGVHAHVIPISKMVQISKDPRFGATKVLLLFETPTDLLKTIEAGVDIKQVNLGSIAHSLGKVVVNPAIAMGKDDVEAFDKLLARGVTFDVRKVPADTSENFDALLQKAKSELA